MQNQFTHERLDAYRVSVEFNSVAEKILASFPKGRAQLVDQLRRASTSIMFNIAEGAGEFAPGDKARFYRFARRSANECAAILDSCRALGIDEELLRTARSLLLRICALTTGLILKQLRLQSDAEAGPGTGSDQDSDSSGSE